MTEKKFLQEVMKKNMPDKEQIRRNCLQQESKRGMKIGWRRRLTTAAACVMAVVFVGTGICYAATGENLFKLFRVLFDDSDPVAVAQMEEGFVESNTVLEFDNLQLKFERYFFDEEQGVILAEMMLETTDGSPVINWEEAYEAAKNMWEVSGIASSAEQWKKVCRENEGQYEIYRETCNDLLTGSLSMEWPLSGGTSMFSLEIEDEATYHIYELFVENSNSEPNLTDTKQNSILKIVYQDEIVGEISMENTGTLRSLSVDERKIVNCSEISLTGAYMQMQFNIDTDKADATEFEIPFDKFKITMKDGHIYQWGDNSFDGETDTEKIDIEEREMYPENEPEVTEIYDYGISYDRQEKNIVLFNFPEFINVDDIVSVTIDGVECLE